MKSNAEFSLTSEQKRAHVEAYVKSNLTRRDYCAREGLKLSNFKNWVTRHGKKPISDFVSVIPAPQQSVIKPPACSTPQMH